MKQNIVTRSLRLLVIGLLVISNAGAQEDAGKFFPVIISTYGATSAPDAPTTATLTEPKPAVAIAAVVPAVAAPPIISSPIASTPVVAQSTFPVVISTPAVVAISSAPSVAVGIELTQALAPQPTLSYAPTAATSEFASFKPLSLDFREMDIVDVLKMLSRQNGINIIIGKNVSGKVTAFFNKVDFWTAFKTILSTRDLAYAREGDLIQVMTESDFERQYGAPFAKTTQIEIIPFTLAKAASAKPMLDTLKSKMGLITVNEATNSIIIEDTPANIEKMKKMIPQLDGTRGYQVFRLSYATAEDILPKITSMVSKDHGNIMVDKRSNTIAVEDNPARLKDIADVVAAFDIRNKAVLIEAKIVQITLNDNFQWGINWQGVDWTAIFNKLNGYHVAGQVVENLLLTPASSVTPGNVTAKGITATVGVLEKPNFQAIINFLDTVGKTNLLSSPRVMALNNQEAKIHVGDKVAKITTTLLNAGSTTTQPITTENVEFLDVGVKLNVTPTIGDDNTITMKVNPVVSSVESTITTADGSSIPVIRVAEAESSLVVKDGITVVLGGLMEDSRATTDTGVPLLQHIPLLGYLFKSQNRTRQKTELVIFLTPHIVTGDVVSPEAQERFALQPTGEPKPKRGFFRRLFGRK